MATLRRSLPALVVAGLLALGLGFWLRGAGEPAPAPVQAAVAAARAADAAAPPVNPDQPGTRGPAPSAPPTAPVPSAAPAAQPTAPAAPVHPSQPAPGAPAAPSPAQADPPPGLPRGKALPAGGLVAAMRAQVADEDLALLSRLGARLGKPAPPVVWKLLRRKRDGASHEDLLRYVRAEFPADLRLKVETVAWLDEAFGVAAPPPKPHLKPAERARLRRALGRTTASPHRPPSAAQPAQPASPPAPAGAIAPSP